MNVAAVLLGLDQISLQGVQDHLSHVVAGQGLLGAGGNAVEQTGGAAVLGGIGIIPGAALGGFVIGILETLSTAIGLSSYRDAIVYGVLIVILLVRPAGILGKNVKEKV